MIQNQAVLWLQDIETLKIYVSYDPKSHENVPIRYRDVNNLRLDVPESLVFAVVGHEGVTLRLQFF